MDKTLWPAYSNLPGEKTIRFKFFVDAANQPTLAAAPMNNYIASVVRTSQGLYTITLTDAAKTMVELGCELNLNAAGATYAVAGPSANFGQSLSAGAPTVQVFVLNAAGAVTDPPAANANVFIAGSVTVTDLGAQ